MRKHVGRRPRTLLVVALVAGAAASLVGVTMAAFTATTTNPASNFSAAAVFPAEYMGSVGTATCGATQNSVTVPAGGVPAGRTVVVQLVLRGGTLGAAVSATDSRGNTYRKDVDRQNGTENRTVVFAAYVATPLVAGDAITVSHGNANSSGIAAHQFRRIAASSPVDATGTNTGASTTPTASAATATANTAIFGAVGASTNVTVNEAGSWTMAHDLYQNCGGGARRARNHGAYRIVAATGTYTYNPTLSGSAAWSEGVVAYKAG